MAEQQGHSAPTSPGVVHQTALTSDPETIGIAHDRIKGPLALRGKAASGTVLASQYRTSRDSQASFDSAKTRASSIAESVFSTSGLRCMSAFSNSARLSSARQDSSDSEPVSAISPWETDRHKSGLILVIATFSPFATALSSQRRLVEPTSVAFTVRATDIGARTAAVQAMLVDWFSED